MNRWPRRGARSLCSVACLVVAALGSSASAEAAFSDFGFKSLLATESTTEAGAHPDVTFSFELKTDPASNVDPTGLRNAFARLRGAVTNLPPGLMGDPSAVPQCTIEEFASFALGGKGCPTESQVGLAILGVYGLNIRLHEPIFNLAPANDRTVARLGFYSGTLPFYVNVQVRPNDYGLVARIDGPPATPVVKGDIELWGVPADSSHDTKRLTPREAFPEGKSESPLRPSGLEPADFMTNPTSCQGPQPFSMEVWSYQEPTRVSELASTFPATTNCADLEFDPSFSLAPTTTRAASPSGLDAVLSMRQNEGWAEKATSHLRNAVVTLPQGMKVSPAAADGLAACTNEQVGAGEEVAADCPDASKIGTAEFDVPVLVRPLQGAIYQRAPEPGHLFRVWLVSDDLGVHVKIPGEIHADKSTGQLTSVFLDNPQVPVRELKLHFKGGPQGLLLTPPACGAHETSHRFDPWAGNFSVEGKLLMTIDQDCEGGGFSPTLVAGTGNSSAGSFAPLVFRVAREDHEENVLSLNATLPPGLLAKLRGVPVCPESLVATGACTEASRVGSVKAAVGGGPTPLWVPQPGKTPTAIFLAGPYKGAPYSLLTAVPAQAGPFDLGTVLTRAGVYIEPATAQVSVNSDPLPQILEGVAIEYRTISIEVDRPDFTLNPTSCDVKQIGATVVSIGGTTAPLSSRFQVGGCSRLRFRPKLSLRLRGETERGGNPALRATLRMPRRGANLARTAVTMPRSAFLDQAHIRTICTRVQFAAKACPGGSVYGGAKAWSSLLAEPLEGPVYLRSSAHRLPDLVAVLRGPASQPVEIHLAGRIDSARGAIRATFESIPDAPVSRFVLAMRGGRKGLLQNSTDLCARSHRATLKTDAHNGKTRDYRVAVKAACRDARPQRR